MYFGAYLVLIMFVQDRKSSEWCDKKSFIRL